MPVSVQATQRDVLVEKLLALRFTTLVPYPMGKPEAGYVSDIESKEYSIVNEVGNPDKSPLKLTLRKTESKEGGGDVEYIPLDKQADFLRAFTLLKGLMFKADQPYRTKLGLGGVMNTNGSGVLAVTVANNVISTTQEWSSIDALFDEFYVHSFTVKYHPYNADGGGGMHAASTVGGEPTCAQAANQVLSCGLSVVAMQGNAGAYTTAIAMLSNPSLKQVSSNKTWTYTWRNNVRYDPRGYTIDATGLTNLGWQGWNFIGAASNVGGFVTIRATNDVVMGDGTHTFSMGHYTSQWDISFRVRA